jgi:hypothetical protein
MLLHVFIGDGQLVKPPEDLLSLNLVVSTAGGYGKGGRDFECGSNWTQGSFLRFHSTIVVGEIDDPKVKKISFELKGCYKNAPAKEISLGIAAIETNQKQKARTLAIELTNIRNESTTVAAGGDGGIESRNASSTVCKLAVTLFHNRFAIDLSPDEVALQHKRELLEIKEKKKSSGPPPHEYSFLLTRKINWDAKRRASFNKDIEHLLDEDVYKNLKDFQVNKKKTKEYKRRHRRMLNKFSKNQPPLAYFARRATVRRPKVGETPYRMTLLGVGYVGERVNPVASFKKERVRQLAQVLSKDIQIPFSSRSMSSARKRRSGSGSGRASSDPLDELYHKILNAEKRRVKLLRKTKNLAKRQADLDRVRAKIIAEKKVRRGEEDERLRKMMQQSDAQMHALRLEINRRRRHIAFIGMAKHLTEADQRKKEAEEAILQQKREARLVLEREAAQALAAASRARSPRRVKRQSEKEPAHMLAAGPKNAYPLRKAPTAQTIAQRKLEQANAAKNAERERQEKEAREAKTRIFEGKLAGAHIPKVPVTKPMPIEKNRVPLRSVDLDKIKARKERLERIEAEERRIQALTAAMEAEMAAATSRSGKFVGGPVIGVPPAVADSAAEVEGVKYHNPYPVRKVNTSSLSLGDLKPRGSSPMRSSGGSSSKQLSHPNFAAIERIVAKEASALDASTDSSAAAAATANATATTTTAAAISYPFTYTLKTGTVLRAQTLKDLQAKILSATRTQESKLIASAQKKRALGIKSVSDRITRESGDFVRPQEPVATPLHLNLKNRAFYNKPEPALSKGGKKNDEEDEEALEAQQADAIMKGLSAAVEDFSATADRHWLASSQSAMAILTSRSVDSVLQTSAAVDAMSAKMSRDDSLLRGSLHVEAEAESAASNTHSSSTDQPAKSDIPGFLSTYAEPLATALLVQPMSGANQKTSGAGADDDEDDLPDWAREKGNAGDGSSNSAPAVGRVGRKSSKKDKKQTAKPTVPSAAITSAAVDELSSGLNTLEANARAPKPKSKKAQDDEDMTLLKKQLQAQGVNVDAKMEEVMASLRLDSAGTVAGDDNHRDM